MSIPQAILEVSQHLCHLCLLFSLRQCLHATTALFLLHHSVFSCAMLWVTNYPDIQLKQGRKYCQFSVVSWAKDCNHYFPMLCRKKSMSLLFIICLDRAKLGAIHRSPFFPFRGILDHHLRRLENGVRNWATASISSLLNGFLGLVSICWIGCIHLIGWFIGLVD